MLTVRRRHLPRAELFQRAQDAAPCIIFLDELQAAFAAAHDDGGAGGGPGGGQLASQLKLQLDALARRPRSSPAVYVIGATNEVGMLDQDLLRPGRFDRVLRVSLPDLSARAAILRSLLSRLPLDLGQLESELKLRGFDAALLREEMQRGACDHGADTSSWGGVHGSLDQAETGGGGVEMGGDSQCSLRILARSLARVTERCSGADLRHLCQLAAYHALERDGNARVLVPSDFFTVAGKVCKTASVNAHAE